MSLKIGPVFERVEGQDTNSNVYKKKKRARIKVF